MKGDLLLVFGSIGTSLFAIPATVLYLVLIRGISTSAGTELLGVGLLALLPGILMGATALWLAARG